MVSGFLGVCKGTAEGCVSVFSISGGIGIACTVTADELYKFSLFICYHLLNCMYVDKPVS